MRERERERKIVRVSERKRVFQNKLFIMFIFYMYKLIIKRIIYIAHCWNVFIKFTICYTHICARLTHTQIYIYIHIFL